MNKIYKQTIHLGADDVDLSRRLRVSRFMRYVQAACIAHTEEAGMGRTMTLDKGFLWVVTSLSMTFARLPEYDETITLECYPGPSLHYFFPRHVRLVSSSGETLGKAVSLWALIDETDRSLIDPEEHGIHIEGFQQEGELLPMPSFPIPPLEQTALLRATYGNTDINGHLNNASYLDFALDLLPLEVTQTPIIEASLLFKKELRAGEEVSVAYGKKGDVYYFACDRFALKARFQS